MDRIVCAVSYFASVPSAEEIWKHRLRFIGVIKTATQKFTIEYLSNIYFQNQGDMSVLLTGLVDRMNPVFGDLFWMDRNRRYLFFTGVSMEKERP